MLFGTTSVAIYKELWVTATLRFSNANVPVSLENSFLEISKWLEIRTFFTRFIYFNTVVGMLFYIISTMNRKLTAQRIIGLQNRCTELF